MKCDSITYRIFSIINRMDPGLLEYIYIVIEDYLFHSKRRLMMGTKFLKVSVVYFVIAVLLGMYMSMAEDYAQSSVHAHLNLLGWVSLALAGLIYCFFPKAGEHVLAKLHFWLHNIGLVGMMVCVFFIIRGVGGFIEVLTPISVILVILGVILFAINVWMNVSVKEKA